MRLHLAAQILLGALYGVALIGLLLYGLNAYVMLTLHWWTRRRPRVVPAPPAPGEWPAVTVQLPLFNERYVARRLLEAVGRLDYPAQRLEIQVLDDSTDETSAIVAEAARGLTTRGVTVRHLRRTDRTGFKAGALAAGLREARGEFIAILDADFVPPPDFLTKTIPHFADPKVAVVQSRWGHLNRDFSLLTLAQSLGIDGHFGVEQPARCWGNLLRRAETCAEHQCAERTGKQQDKLRGPCHWGTVTSVERRRARPDAANNHAQLHRERPVNRPFMPQPVNSR